MMSELAPKSLTNFLATSQLVMIMNSSTIFQLYILFLSPMFKGSPLESSSKMTSFLSKTSQVLLTYLLFSAIFLSMSNFYLIEMSSDSVIYFSSINFFLFIEFVRMSWAYSQDSWAVLVTIVFQNLDYTIYPFYVILKNALKESLLFFAFRARMSISYGGIMWIVLWGRYIDVPFIAISLLFTRWEYEVTSDMWTPTQQSPWPSGSSERPSSMSTEF